MVTFHTERKINAPISEVWKIISDIDREPEFWHGTRSIRNLSKAENVIEREVVIAFRNSTCKEKVTIEPPKSVTTEIIEGPLKGKKVVQLLSIDENACIVNVEWDIKISGFMGVFSKMVQKHILDGSNQALERISKLYK